MKLEPFENKLFFTTHDAHNMGISSRMLTYYVEKGKITRIAQGVYQATDYEPMGQQLQWQDMVVAAACIKNGVICLISALSFYELTDERMTKFWIAVPNSSPHAKFPMTQIIRMRNIKLGVRNVEIAGVEVRIFDRERTVVDSFRLLDLETSLKALKLYLSSDTKKPDIAKLDSYITKLRVSKMRHYLTALLA